MGIKELKQEMIVEQDTLIITDPCYLLTDEDWDDYCNKEFSGTPIGLDNYLRDYHNFGELIAIDTKVGDWSNTVYNTDTEEVLGNFTADAGMVIVCTASDLTNYGYNKEELDRLIAIGCVAIIENFTGTVRAYIESDDSINNSLTVIEGISKDSDGLLFNTEHLY